jgi:hypothetical protein
MYHRWQITLISVVSSSDMTDANMVSVPTEEHNRYIAYIIIYSPSAHVHLTLHGQHCIRYENVLMS